VVPSFFSVQSCSVDCYDTVTNYLGENPLILGAAFSIHAASFIYKGSTESLSLECCSQFYNPLLQVVAIRIGTALIIECFRENITSVKNKTFFSEIVKANELAFILFSSVFLSKSIMPYFLSCHDREKKMFVDLALALNESSFMKIDGEFSLKRCQDLLFSLFSQLDKNDQLFVVLVLPMVLTVLLALFSNRYQETRRT
jgi:hypothetical protein